MDQPWQILQSYRREKRARNLAAADPTGWTQHTPYHWGREIAGKKLDYWPSSRKWMYDGQVMTGNVQDFIKAIEAKNAHPHS